MEDLKEWLLLGRKCLFWSTLGPIVLIWKGLKLLNCLVAHRKYHFNVGAYEFYQYHCEKCSTHTLPEGGIPGMD